MIGDIKDLKILKPVVMLDTVSVVYVLPPVETAPEMLFHNVAMLKYVVAASSEPNISAAADGPIDRAPRYAAAIHRTESDASASEPGRFNLEHVSTNFAGDIDHSSASSWLVTVINISEKGTA